MTNKAEFCSALFCFPFLLFETEAVLWIFLLHFRKMFLTKTLYFFLFCDKIIKKMFGVTILTKTNAMRILDKEKIEYTAVEYPVDEKDLSGVHIASVTGMNPDFVFKTIVARGDKNGLSVFCIPCDMELDLKKCARVTGDKKIELLPVKELLANTGYIRGGCSPIGMKKAYATYMDETCELFEKIAVSAGVRGCMLLLRPKALVELVGITLADLIV